MYTNKCIRGDCNNRILETAEMAGIGSRNYDAAIRQRKAAVNVLIWHDLRDIKWKKQSEQPATICDKKGEEMDI